MLQAIFGKKTVTDVLGVFNKVIADLESVQEQNRKEAEEKRIEADQAIAARMEALSEINRAETAIQHIKKLVGLEVAQDINEHRLTFHAVAADEHY